MRFACGIVAFLATLAALAPASLSTLLVERASRGVLVLREPQGSAWSGSARLYARSPSRQLLEIGPLGWQVRLAGTELALPGGRALVEISTDAVTVHGLEVQFPAAVLAAFHPALQALGPQGTVRLRSQRLELEERALLGHAEVEWRGAKLERARGLELGSHVARLRGAGARVDVELASLEGALRLEGGGSFTPGGAFAISGAAEARSAALAAFLKSVCAETRGERCFFRYARGATPG